MGATLRHPQGRAQIDPSANFGSLRHSRSIPNFGVLRRSIGIYMNCFKQTGYAQSRALSIFFFWEPKNDPPAIKNMGPKFFMSLQYSRRERSERRAGISIFTRYDTRALRAPRRCSSAYFTTYEARAQQMPGWLGTLYTIRRGSAASTKTVVLTLRYTRRECSERRDG